MYQMLLSVVTSWLMVPKFQKNVKGLRSLSLKIITPDLKSPNSQIGQILKILKMALTHSFLVTQGPDFTLLHWFTNLRNFCFLNKNFRGQTKSLVAILYFGQKRIPEAAMEGDLALEEDLAAPQGAAVEALPPS